MFLLFFWPGHFSEVISASKSHTLRSQDCVGRPGRLTHLVWILRVCPCVSPLQKRNCFSVLFKILLDSLSQYFCLFFMLVLWTVCPTCSSSRCSSRTSLWFLLSPSCVCDVTVKIKDLSRREPLKMMTSEIFSLPHVTTVSIRDSSEAAIISSAVQRLSNEILHHKWLLKQK